MLLNSARPYSEETQRLAEELSGKYQIDVLPVNCAQLKKEDIYHILEVLLMGFPLTSVEFYMPKWVEMLQMDHEIKSALVNAVKSVITHKNTIKKLKSEKFVLDSMYVDSAVIDSVDLATGIAKIRLAIEEQYYYEMLSKLTGQHVENEYELIALLRDLAAMEQEYRKVLVAMEKVRNTGYGVVMPEQNEINLEAPEVIKHGNKFGVKMKAKSPSIHMIRAAIETEIAPIVGTQEQAEDLINYIKAADNTENGVWETNIFGKTIEQLVQDGIQTKVNMIGEESQLKLQESMQKIVNDMNGGMVCIII